MTCQPPSPCHLWLLLPYTSLRLGLPHSPSCSVTFLSVPVQAQCGASHSRWLPGVPVLTDTYFLGFFPTPPKLSYGSQVIFLHHSPEKYREVSHALGQSEPWFSSFIGSVNPRTEYSDTLRPRSGAHAQEIEAVTVLITCPLPDPSFGSLCRWGTLLLAHYSKPCQPFCPYHLLTWLHGLP